MNAPAGAARRLGIAVCLGLLLGLPVGVSAADAVETSGHVLRAALPAAALALTFRRDDAPGRRELYRSFAANVVATWALKHAIDQRRPDGDGLGFPSGHASMAFQSAAFLHRRYGAADAWPAYLLAGYVGWTRIEADRHDLGDVLGGAALGVVTSFLLTRPRALPAEVIPVAGPELLGLRVRIAF